MIDTGGIDSTSGKFTQSFSQKADPKKINDLIRQQAFIALEQANAIIYITDVTEGINQVDKRIASWLRRKYPGIAEDRIVLVVNKVDNDERSENVEQFIRLGLGEPIACSAAHSAGLSEVFYKAMMKMIKFQDTTIAMAIENAQQKRQLRMNNENIEKEVENYTDTESDAEFDVPWEALVGNSENNKETIDNLKKITGLEKTEKEPPKRKYIESLEDIAEEEKNEEKPSKTLKLAILGRPNVGKSSILNAVVGKNRAIVSNIAGTTHDPIDEKIRWRDENDILIIDTAGIRRRGHHKIGIESLTVLWALQIIERSEVILLVIDAKDGVLRQDKRLASEIIDRNRSVIVVVNKWDGKVKRKNKVSFF